MPPPSSREHSSLPPPPPPPPPEDLRSKMSPFVQNLRTAPPSYFYQAPTPSPAVHLFKAPTGPYFFYGTLSDPSMLSDILDLNEEPEIRPAYLIGYRCKMWGQYPALVDAPGLIVKGTAYYVRTEEDGEKLAAYETSNYRTESCILRYTDGKEPSVDLGYTFKFSGNIKDLDEGDFDLTLWLKRIGRQAAADKAVAKEGSA